MTLTLQDIPADIDRALRTRAQAQGKSIDQVAVEAIQAGLGLAAPVKKRDLSGIAGSWIDDPEVDAALRDQDRVDVEAWT